MLLTMACISHMMLEKGVVVIDYNELLNFLDKYQIPESLLESNEYLLIYEINGRRVVMYRHLTQQEYFAALHVVVEAIPLCDVMKNSGLHGVIHLASGLQGALIESSNSSLFLISYLSSIMRHVRNKKLATSSMSKAINTSKHYVYEILQDIKNDELTFSSGRLSDRSYMFLMSLYEYQNPSKELLSVLSGAMFAKTIK